MVIVSNNQIRQNFKYKNKPTAENIESISCNVHLTKTTARVNDNKYKLF